jgi:hypothetical protein
MLILQRFIRRVGHMLSRSEERNIFALLQKIIPKIFREVLKREINVDITFSKRFSFTLTPQ